MWWPFGKTKKVQCPDGTERIIYKNIDDVFPLVAKDWSTRLEVTVKALTELQGSLGLEFEKYIEGFFAQLDEANRNVQFNFRAIYATYTTNPCELNGYLAREIRKVIERENDNRLKRLEIEISKIKSLRSQGANEQALKQNLSEAQARLSKSNIEEERASEFQKVEEKTSEWMERKQ